MSTTALTRERRERLKALVAELEGIDRRAARMMWDWGVRFKEIEDDELWREAGSTSFYAWCEEHTPYSPQTARRAIEVARHFSAEMTEKHGSTKLAATLNYLALTRRDEEAGDVQALEIRFRGEDGTFTTVPFAKASVRQIQSACKQLQEAAAARNERAAAKAVDSSLRARIAKLSEVLPEAPKGSVRGERLQVHKGRDGEIAVSFKGIPVAELDAFVKAVKAHLIDG